MLIKRAMPFSPVFAFSDLGGGSVGLVCILRAGLVCVLIVGLVCILRAGLVCVLIVGLVCILRAGLVCVWCMGLERV